MAFTISKTRMAEILAALRAREDAKHQTQAAIPTEHIATPEIDAIDSRAETTNKYGQVITYNEKQQEIINRVANGESVILIGPAGTGKTTAMKGATSALIQSGRIGTLQSTGHKHLVDGTPGLVCCAYTLRATNNIRNNVSDDVKHNCVTIHKLLEYQPVYYDITDPVSGLTRTTMRFEPTRNEHNPFPASLRAIFFEESTMISVDLFKELLRACHDEIQFVFLGDIQQLPPVFGPAILGFKLLELPAVELTDVYRQALESPIMVLLHRILSGKTIPESEFKDWKHPKQLTIRAWKKKISEESATKTAALLFVGNEHLPGVPDDQKVPGGFKNGLYDPEEDMILLPFNKGFGTIELNKHIANALSKIRGEPTHEIIAGFNKHYLSIGDRVLYNKEDAVVLDIYPNSTYIGNARPQVPSLHLDYWGFNSDSAQVEVMQVDTDMDFILAQAASLEKEDRVHAASHKIVLAMQDSGVELTLSSASELNELLLGYCLTVHKAQGSEWRKVFFLLHQTHNQMVFRELLYTGCSRAREELYIICEPDHFEKGIRTQRVKGETLAEKAEYFKGKLKEGYTIDV